MNLYRVKLTVELYQEASSEEKAGVRAAMKFRKRIGKPRLPICDIKIVECNPRKVTKPNE